MTSRIVNALVFVSLAAAAPRIVFAQTGNQAIVDGNARLRNQLRGVWQEIIALQDKAKECLANVNMYRENLVAVCPIGDVGSTVSLITQQTCILREIAEAAKQHDVLKKAFSDSWKCKIYNALDWAVGKFCGEYPTICSVVRDGRACMTALANANSAQYQAMRNVWRAVPGVGEIVVDGWSMTGIARLAREVATNTAGVARAAGEAVKRCWDASMSAAVTVGRRVGEVLCGIEPGPIVCPIVRAAAACLVAAKSAKLPTAVWQGLEQWRGGVAAITEAIVRGFNAEAVRKQVATCEKAVRLAGADIQRHAAEVKRLLGEGWQALKSFNCGKLVELFSRFDPLQGVMNAVAPEFVATCAVGFKKGFICHIPDVLKMVYDVLAAAATGAVENPLVCGVVGVAVPGAVLGCGIATYLKNRAPKIIAGAKKFWGCIKHLSGYQWFDLVKNATCEFAGGLALDAVLMLLSEGGYLPAFAARIMTWMHHHQVLTRSAMATMAAGMEFQHKCGGGHGESGGHGGSAGGGGHGTEHGTAHPSGGAGSGSGTTHGGGHATGGGGTASTGGGAGGHAGGAGGAAGGGPATVEQPKGKVAYVTATWLHIRARPSIKGKLLDSVKRCTKLTLVEEKSAPTAWTKVNWKRKTGFVATEYLSATPCAR